MKHVNSHAMCRKPDRDSPELVCGYPLPCPHHTAIIDLGANPPTLTVPLDASAGGRIADIARALSKDVIAKAPPIKSRRRIIR